jgi:hypothetical protein
MCDQAMGNVQVKDMKPWHGCEIQTSFLSAKLVLLHLSR